MSLVAEGFKRLGTLSYLIRNGSVKKGSVLFWDEPEMNLNASPPARAGENPDGACQDGGAGYFVLPQPVPAAGADDSAFRTPQCHGAEKVFRDEACRGGTFRGKGVLGESLEDVGPVESLEAEIEQADRYLKLSYES